MTPEWKRMLASMRFFFPSVGEGSEGYRVLRLDGVLACVTPAVPERSLPNCVIYEGERDLEAAYDALQQGYEEAGVDAWTVWVPEYHERARHLLEDAGHVLDATPAAMIADLAEVEPPRPDDPGPDANPTWPDLGAINDLAYGTGDSFARMLGGNPTDSADTYIARVDGTPAASVVTTDHGGDCAIWWVATIPEARGRGLAPGLMRRALAAGRERGCDVSTLQATKVGEPVYERLGYRAFGTVEMWERRKAPA